MNIEICRFVLTTPAPRSAPVERSKRHEVKLPERFQVTNTIRKPTAHSGRTLGALWSHRYNFKTAYGLSGRIVGALWASRFDSKTVRDIVGTKWAHNGRIAGALRPSSVPPRKGLCREWALSGRIGGALWALG